MNTKRKMIKVYLSIILLVGVISSSFWAGYQVASGREAKRENKVIKAEVINHNEDIISLEKHTNEIAEIQKRYQKELAKLSLVQPDSVCAVDDFSGLWNEAIAITNSMHIENTGPSL